MFTTPELIAFIFSILGSISIILLFLMWYFNRVRYEKNKIMTAGELRFYKVLKYAVRNKYDVLAQVRLANVVKIQDKYFIWKKFNLLGAKCVDFVLIDWQTGETKLVIELDDRSHERPDRIRRDKFVDSVLKESGVPILHHKYQARYETSEIRKVVEEKVVK